MKYLISKKNSCIRKLVFQKFCIIWNMQEVNQAADIKMGGNLNTYIHQVPHLQNFARNELYIPSMYFYKVWAWDFIDHVHNPHSILGHFLDRGFLGWQAQNWVSVVPCPTNSTQSSTIYKLTSGLADYRNLSENK